MTFNDTWTAGVPLSLGFPGIIRSSLHFHHRLWPYLGY
jgi:hypothetical protein